jgi:starch synthase
MGTGFCFTQYNAAEFKAAVDRALALWPDRDRWRRLMTNGMAKDFSWNKSAKKYVETYERMLGAKPNS